MGQDDGKCFNSAAPNGGYGVPYSGDTEKAFAPFPGDRVDILMRRLRFLEGCLGPLVERIEKLERAVRGERQPMTLVWFDLSPEDLSTIEALDKKPEPVASTCSLPKIDPGMGRHEERWACLPCKQTGLTGWDSVVMGPCRYCDGKGWMSIEERRSYEATKRVLDSFDPGI